MKYKYIILALILWGCGGSKKETEFKRRYFFVSYTIQDHIRGNFFSNGVLMNYSQWEETIRKDQSCRGNKYSVDDIVIMGLYEFKDSIEYNDFKSGYNYPLLDCKEDTISTTDATSLLIGSGVTITTPTLTIDTANYTLPIYVPKKGEKPSWYSPRDTIYVYRDTCGEHRTLEYIPLPGILDTTERPIKIQLHGNVIQEWKPGFFWVGDTLNYGTIINNKQ